MFFAANISLLFTEVSLTKRFASAKSAGFDAVEILFPYELPASLLRKAANKAGLPIVLINTPPGDWNKGECGHAAISGSSPLFREGLRQATDYATALDVKFIHIMSGKATDPAAMATFVENLYWATRTYPNHSFLIEPLNSFDFPNYFLSNFDLAKRVLKEVSAPNLGLQFDAYHAARMGLNPAVTFREFSEHIRHVQIASFPDRRAPTVEEHRQLFKNLAASQYKYTISAEYRPNGLTEESLGWLAEFREL